MPRPLSSTRHAPRPKSSVTSTLVAFASNAFLSSSSTTPASETMAVDDVMWAMASSGRGRMAGRGPRVMAWRRDGEDEEEEEEMVVVVVVMT